MVLGHLWSFHTSCSERLPAKLPFVGTRQVRCTAVRLAQSSTCQHVYGCQSHRIHTEARTHQCVVCYRDGPRKGKVCRGKGLGAADLPVDPPLRSSILQVAQDLHRHTQVDADIIRRRPDYPLKS